MELFDQSIIFKEWVGIKSKNQLVAILDVLKFFNIEVLQELQDFMLLLREQGRQLRMVDELWRDESKNETIISLSLKVLCSKILTAVHQKSGTFAIISDLLA